jgi:type IV pilus assembly protein PilZ
MPQTDNREAFGATDVTPLQRRRFERLPVEIEVNLTSDHNFYTAFTQNISEGGLFVATTRLLPVGTLIEFSFTLNDDPDPIRAKGRVRWVRDPMLYNRDTVPGMGIEFIELDPPTQKRVNDFIARKRDSLFYDD